MKLVAIDGYAIADIQDVHKLFVKELNFPFYYGYNLDALYDCLSESGDETIVAITNPTRLHEVLGEHYNRLLALLKRETEESRFVRLVIFPDKEDSAPDMYGSDDC